MSDADQDQTGISRRSLIKRGAIVGGAAVWAAPVVQSFTSPAGAQVTPGPGGSLACEACLIVVVNVPGLGTFSTKTTFPNPSDQEAFCQCFFSTGNPFTCASTTPGALTVPCGGPAQPACTCP